MEDRRFPVLGKVGRASLLSEHQHLGLDPIYG